MKIKRLAQAIIIVLALLSVMSNFLFSSGISLGGRLLSISELLVFAALFILLDRSVRKEKGASAKATTRDVLLKFAGFVIVITILGFFGAVLLLGWFFSANPIG